MCGRQPRVKLTLMKPTGRKAKAKSEPVTLGRDAFAHISAVEGIALDPEMDEDFRSFDRRNLPAGARRLALARKYGRTPA